MTDEFTEQEIYRMRGFLAKRWRQSITQVTDYEAKAYLRVEREMKDEISKRNDGDKSE